MEGTVNLQVSRSETGDNEGDHVPRALTVSAVFTPQGPGLDYELQGHSRQI